MPLAIDPASTRVAPQALTVGEVVLRIRQLIAQQFPAAIWVEGELSNCSYSAKGHIYFSLVDERQKDRSGQQLILPCAFFRHANQFLKFRLENGMKVLCYGQITTYEAKGQYQLQVQRLEPKGIGALQLAFEQLKKRLEFEGLFDPARKRPIPKLPERIGIVTSPTGSVIHDMLARLRGRFHLVLLPVRVQGEGAAQDIAEAIRLANAKRLADVLIVGRGGGSLEELWAFNEERVARAIFSSEIPIISAVGHEDHWTIADYVADLRASTPTHAAQLLAHDAEAIRDQCRDLIQRLLESFDLFFDEQDHRLDSVQAQLRLLHPLNQLTEYTRMAHQCDTRLLQSMRHALEREERTLQAFTGRLHALSPLAVLARGYSITFRLPERHVLMRASAVHPGDALETRLAHGVVVSTVTSTQPDS